jgi:polyphosphate glucokinase
MPGRRRSRRRGGRSAPAARAEPLPRRILVVDLGGSKIKILASGHAEPRKAPSGKKLTPTELVAVVKRLARGWVYDAIALGYPGIVGSEGPRNEPGNLGGGWVGFDYATAFGRPVRIINDAAMQALGSYEGGRMLFVGLGTGVGASLIADNVLVMLELGALPWDGDLTLFEVLGNRGRQRLGRKVWRRRVAESLPALMNAFVADYLVLGGGNAKFMKELPPGVRLGHNLTAFRGGFRLWHVDDVPTMRHDGGPQPPPEPPAHAEWRVL